MNSFASFFLNSVKFILLITIMGPTNVHSQEDPLSGITSPLVNIIPPPPTEAALAKYGAIPVSKYTGVPNISLPLYELTQGKIRVPISLSYHASGFKVDEISSWVGLGWSLNAGGVISRTVVGLPDEQLTGGYLNSGILASPNPYPSNFLNSSIAFEDLFAASSSEANLDLEPDVFNFNFMGFSGTFFIEPLTKECYVTSPSEISIEFTGNSFIAYDFQGIVYEFNISNDMSTNRGQSVNGDSYTFIPSMNNISSWYLTRIWDQNSGDKIEFSYKPNVEEYDTWTSDTYNHKHCVGEAFNPSGILIRTKNVTVSNGKVLEYITGGNTKVKFITTSRSDLSNNSGCRLSEISIMNSDTTETFKSYTLIHSYFSSTGGDYLSKRLKLDQLVTQAGTGSANEIYSFQYNDPLPPRNSKQKDYWGYYNGRAENDNKPSNVPAMQVNGEYYDGVVLEPDTSGVFLQASTLKRITYPTKGYTQFYYEPHRYSSYYNGTLLVNVDSSYREDPTSGNVFYSPINPDNYYEFELYKDMNVEFSRSLNPEYYEAYLTDDQDQSLFTVCKDNSTETRFMFQGTYRLRIRKFPTAPIDEPPYPGASVTFSARGGALPAQESAGGLRIKMISNHNQNGEIVGTKRYDYDINDTEASSGVLMNHFKMFNYNTYGFCVQEFMTLIVSVFNRTNINQSVYALTQGSPVGYREVEELLEDSSRIVSEFQILPDKFYGGPNIVGTFEVEDGVPPATPTLPAPTDDKDYLRGRLKAEHLFNSEGDTVKSVEYNYSTPVIRHFSGVRSKIIVSEPGWEEVNNPIYHQIGYTKYLKTIEFSKLDSKVVKYFRSSPYQYIMYDSGINSPIPITNFGYSLENTSFTYNPDWQLSEKKLTNYQIVNIEESDSIILVNGFSKVNYFFLNEYKVKFKYARDWEALQGVNFSGVLHTEMVNRKMLALPISSEIYHNGQLAEGKANRYDYRESIDDYIVLKDYYELNIGDTEEYEKKVKDLRYNNSGRIIQQEDISGVKTSFFWGYNQSFPVAKFENMSYDNIDNNVNGLRTELEKLEDSSKMDDPIQRNQLKDLNEAIRQKTPAGVLVTTYTYDPLVGITSQTDPNGRTTYYEYDGLGRLVRVRDHEGNILQEYEYHYAN